MTAYRKLFRAAIAEDRDALFVSARAIGYFQEEMNKDQRESLLDLFLMATEPARHQGLYDFAESDLTSRISEAGMTLSMEKGYWHTPPADALFLHRKLGGMFMLASRLQARVDVRQILAEELMDDRRQPHMTSSWDLANSISPLRSWAWFTFR